MAIIRVDQTLKNLTTFANDLSPLALAISAQSAASQSQALIKSESVLPTPTIYYDPTAVNGTGSGSSVENACYTISQLQTAANGDKPGAVIGFKRGTVTPSEIVLTIGSSQPDKPVLIVPYGDPTQPLPLIDTGAPVTGWTVYSGSIYQVSVGSLAKPFWQVMPDGSQQRVAWITDTSLTNKIAKLNAAGPGYGFWDSNTFYCIPYNLANPNSGIMIAPSSSTPTMASGGGGLSIAYNNAAITGNIIVYGLAVRHTFGSGIWVSVGATSNIVGIGQVSIIGCDIEHCGRPIDVVNTLGTSIMPNGGGDDGIVVYGKNNTIRTSVRVANNFVRDVGNNACELGFTSSGYVEFNTAVDTGSHGLSENYASVSNVLCRYNFATWQQNNLYPWYNNGTACYMGRATWQAAFDQTNYQSGSGQSATTAAQSVNNSWIGNVALNCPAACGYSGTAILDDGCSGLVFKNNTFVISSPGNTITSPLIFGNQLSASWNTPPSTPVDWNNNIFSTTQVQSNCRMMYVSPNYNTGYAPTGDNNIWFSNAANWLNYFNLNGTDYNAISGPATLAAWVAGSAMDSHSQWINPLIDANGQPFLFSPAIRAGAYAGKQMSREGSPLFDL